MSGRAQVAAKLAGEASLLSTLGRHTPHSGTLTSRPLPRLAQSRLALKLWPTD